MAAKGGTLEEMLLLSTGVLCSDLLAVYALDRETLLIPGRRYIGQ